MAEAVKEETPMSEDQALEKLIKGTVGDVKDTEVVVINTDWKLETAGVKTFGMCFVRVSPPYSHLNFKRGFSLPNPTHQRCALFALIMGVELVDSVPVGTERPRFVISTKNKWTHEVLSNGIIDRWDATGRWPKSVSSMKGLLLRLRDVVAELPERSHVVCIERDKDDSCEVDLETKDDDVDAEKIMQRGGGPEAIQKALRDMRMKNAMVQELLASGARGSRAKKKMPVQKKKATPVKQQLSAEQKEVAKAISDNSIEKDGITATADSPIGIGQPAAAAGTGDGPGPEVRPAQVDSGDAPIS